MRENYFVVNWRTQILKLSAVLFEFTFNNEKQQISSPMQKSQTIRLPFRRLNKFLWLIEIERKYLHHVLDASSSVCHDNKWIRLADICLADSGWARLDLSTPFLVGPFINPVLKLPKQYTRLQVFSVHRHVMQFFVEEFRLNRKKGSFFASQQSATHVMSNPHFPAKIEIANKNRDVHAQTQEKHFWASCGGPPKINAMPLPFFLSNGAPLAWAFGNYSLLLSNNLIKW